MHDISTTAHWQLRQTQQERTRITVIAERLQLVLLCVPDLETQPNDIDTDREFLFSMSHRYTVERTL